MALSEDALCRAFAFKMAEAPEFVGWVLAKTKFAPLRDTSRLLWEEQARRWPHVLPERWWRHWWCTVPELSHQRETDIFLVFEVAGTNDRFALLIENKLKSDFLPGQAEGYEPKGRFMAAKPEYLNFSEFQTVLIAPAIFRMANREKSDIFDCYISYEALSEFIPEVRLN
jgi:hypothetical protein